MNIYVIQVGKTKTSFLSEGINEYKKRLQPFIDLHLIDTKEETHRQNESDQIHYEGEHILQQLEKLAPDTTKIGLAIEGKPINSQQLARFIDDQRQLSKNIAFVIGGQYGLADGVKRKCDVLLSFSPLTFTHEMIRLLLLEQIYRSYTIINNKPYHY